jgi:hypothetical protein
VVVDVDVDVVAVVDGDGDGDGIPNHVAVAGHLNVNDPVERSGNAAGVDGDPELPCERASGPPCRVRRGWALRCEQQPRAVAR